MAKNVQRWFSNRISEMRGKRKNVKMTNKYIVNITPPIPVESKKRVEKSLSFC